MHSFDSKITYQMQKTFTLLFFLLAATYLSAQSNLLISGVIDGPLPGGTPKAVELYVLNDIADLSIYGLGAANNGGGTDGQEYTFPADAVTAGTYLYVTTDGTDFNTYFGFNADYVDDQMNSSVNINGDDAIELFQDGSVVDVFGDIDTDGTGTPWEYKDGWAYRIDGTGPDGSTFVEQNWTYTGIDVLDDETSNSTAAFPFPVGTYSPTGSDLVIANDDFATTDVNVSVDIDILANDLIPGSLTSVAVVDDPSDGVATIVNNQLTYFPSQDFCGTDVMEYEVCNNTSCDTAMVTVTIDCPFSYPIYDIATVTTVDMDGKVDSLETLCELSGIVYGVNTRGQGGFQFTMIDAGNNGINVFSSEETFGYTVNEGDEIIVRGEITQFNGLTEIIPDELILVSVNNTLINPLEVEKPTESTESSLIEIINLEIIDPNQWGDGMFGFNIDVTNGVDTFEMRIDNDTEIFNEPIDVVTNPDLFGVIGIGGQFDSSEPYTEGYQIAPRFNSDFFFVDPESTIEPAFAKLIQLSPNPVVDILTIEMQENFDQLNIRAIDGSLLQTITPQNLRLDVNMNNWPAGMYLISFIKNNKTWTTKVVK
jgi:hypothetical protein